MSELNEVDYRGSFEALAQRITETMQGGKTAASKKKIVDYLLYRGWESEWIYDWINQLQ
jgi:regulatory protein